MIELYKYVAKNKIPENDDRFENIVASFLERFWNRYKSKCYIWDDYECDYIGPKRIEMIGIRTLQIKLKILINWRDN